MRSGLAAGRIAGTSPRRAARRPLRVPRASRPAVWTPTCLPDSLADRVTTPDPNPYTPASAEPPAPRPVHRMRATLGQRVAGGVLIANAVLVLANAAATPGAPQP